MKTILRLMGGQCLPCALLLCSLQPRAVAEADDLAANEFEKRPATQKRGPSSAPASKMQHLASPDQIPEGLTKSNRVSSGRLQYDSRI